MKQGHFPRNLSCIALTCLSLYACSREHCLPSFVPQYWSLCAYNVGSASRPCLHCWQASCHSAPFISSFTIFSPGTCVWYLLVGACSLRSRQAMCMTYCAACGVTRCTLFSVSSPWRSRCCCSSRVSSPLPSRTSNWSSKTTAGLRLIPTLCLDPAQMCNDALLLRFTLFGG